MHLIIRHILVYLEIRSACMASPLYLGFRIIVFGKGKAKENCSVTRAAIKCQILREGFGKILNSI